MDEHGSNNFSSNPNKANSLVDYFCRHLVALCITFQHLDDKKQPIGDIKFDASPGIVINIRGIYYFLTAGHILKDLENLLSKKMALIYSSVLADTFGINSTSPQPIPFDFLNEPKFFIDNDDEGLDFGLIMLRKYYIELLDKNGIIAIHEENWIKQNSVDFHSYAMLGLPYEFITEIQRASDQNMQTLGTVSPTLIFIQKSTNSIENLKKTKYPRFIGQMPNDMPLRSIIGMSGGPIFGFNHDTPMRYWIVAIQSAWLKTRKIIFGCPIPVLANLLTKWTDEVLKENPEL